MCSSATGSPAPDSMGPSLTLSSLSAGSAVLACLWESRGPANHGALAVSLSAARHVRAACGWWFRSRAACPPSLHAAIVHGKLSARRPQWNQVFYHASNWSANTAEHARKRSELIQEEQHAECTLIPNLLCLQTSTKRIIAIATDWRQREIWGMPVRAIN